MAMMLGTANFTNREGIFAFPKGLAVLSVFITFYLKKRCLL